MTENKSSVLFLPQRPVVDWNHERFNKRAEKCGMRKFLEEELGEDWSRQKLTVHAISWPDNDEDCNTATGTITVSGRNGKKVTLDSSYFVPAS